jgi:tripartite-type tricarboxylate transporter receptor subunit TctC
MRRRLLLNALLTSVTACFALLTSPASAQAQAFPTKTVRIVVPQTPGGASDTLARIMATKLATRWGQPVVVENKAGAGGNIGMEEVARAAADGYTLLMSYVGTHAINGALYAKLPFDPEKDFAPVATLAVLPYVVLVNTNSPVKTLGELVELSRRQGVNFGSAGNGSVNHLLGEMFNATANVKFQHIPYRGAAPAMTDLLGGQIQTVFTSLPSAAGFIRDGRLRPLAVTSAKRSVGFPDIPTVAESGYPGFDVAPWFGFFATGGTPAAVIRQMNADINDVLKSPDVIEKFSAAGAEVYATTPAQFGAILKDDIAKWSKVVKASGAKLD